jgi:hypothetical protein
MHRNKLSILEKSEPVLIFPMREKMQLVTVSPILEDEK